MLYPQISKADGGAARAQECEATRGYDCATPGYERPVTLNEALEISKVETVVYLYGPGLQGADLAADVMQDPQSGRAIHAVAIPGLEVPQDTFYVIVLGRVVKHRASNEPVEFYQRFINRGEVFALTWKMYDRLNTVDGR